MHFEEREKVTKKIASLRGSVFIGESFINYVFVKVDVDFNSLDHQSNPEFESSEQ